MTERPIWSPPWRALLIALALGIIIWGCAGFVAYSMAQGATSRCESRGCLERAISWQRQDRLRLQKLLAQRLRPDVELAYRLAIGYRLVPVTNAVANVLVAARWIAAHGSSEFQCRLDGSVKHGGAYS